MSHEKTAVTETSLIPAEGVERTILILRGRRVILDSDLAALYGVSAKRLNEQVRRNADRFPQDFAFQLTPEEFQILRSQNATSRWGGRRFLPYAFTEHGAYMAGSVLNSPRAIAVSIQVVRTFIKLREFLSSHRQLAAKLEELEKKIASHDKHIVTLFDAVRSLMGTPRNDYVTVSGFQGKKPARR
jgi:hypothetical protein